MRIGITGAAGHLGGYVLGQLLHTTGHDIVTLDTRDHIDPEMLHDIGIYDPIDHIVGDVRDTDTITELTSNVDAVIHLATAPPDPTDDPTRDTDIVGAINVFTAATARDIPVVHVTALDTTLSQTITETHAHHTNTTGGRITTVRTGALYGHHRPITAPDGLTETAETITRFVVRALTGNTLDLPGGGTNTGNWTFVDDAAHVIVHALTTTLETGPPARTIELGPNPNRSLHDAAYLCAEAAAHERGKAHKPAINYLPGPAGPDHVQADVETLWQIGVDPDTLTPLEEGIAYTIANYAADFYTTH